MVKMPGKTDKKEIDTTEEIQPAPYNVLKSSKASEYHRKKCDRI